MEQKGFTKIIKIIINRCNNCVDVRINQTILESALKFGPFFEHLLQFNSSIYKIEIWAEIHQALYYIAKSLMKTETAEFAPW